MTFVTCFECAAHSLCRRAKSCAQGNDRHITSITPPIDPRLQNLPRDLPPGIYSVGKEGVRPIDTTELGPIRVPTPSYRQTQARIVREALEAAAIGEPDRNAAQHLIEAARRCDTETLAYLSRLLKG